MAECALCPGCWDCKVRFDSVRHGDRVTATNLLGSIPIVDIWYGLGGGPLKRNRGLAFWRNGKRHNVSLNHTKGCWYDHRDAVGGGKLDLIQIVLGCDRKSALRWLVDFSGTSDYEKPHTPRFTRRTL